MAIRCRRLCSFVMVKGQVVRDDGGSNLGKTSMLKFALKLLLILLKKGSK